MDRPLTDEEVIGICKMYRNIEALIAHRSTTLELSVWGELQGIIFLIQRLERSISKE